MAVLRYRNGNYRYHSPGTETVRRDECSSGVGIPGDGCSRGMSVPGG